MKLKNALMAVVGLSACAIVLTGGGNAEAQGTNKVCFYDGFNYTGNSYCAAPGFDTNDCDAIFIDGKKQSWNKRFSSIKIIGTAKVTIWEGKDFTGPSLKMHHSEPDLRYVKTADGGTRNWNKSVSSYKTHY